MKPGSVATDGTIWENPTVRIKSGRCLVRQEHVSQALDFGWRKCENQEPAKGLQEQYCVMERA